MDRLIAVLSIADDDMLDDMEDDGVTIAEWAMEQTLEAMEAHTLPGFSVFALASFGEDGTVAYYNEADWPAGYRMPAGFDDALKLAGELAISAIADATGARRMYIEEMNGDEVMDLLCQKVRDPKVYYRIPALIAGHAPNGEWYPWAEITVTTPYMPGAIALDSPNWPGRKAIAFVAVCA
jgi:hypothetical protein